MKVTEEYKEMTEAELDEALSKVLIALDRHPKEASVQSRYLDEHGREIPNPTPMQPPIGYRKHKSIAETIREQVLAISREAADAGQETEDEANDFDVGEDMEPHSPWENDFDIDPAMEHMLARASAPPSPKPASKPQEGQAPSAPVPPEAPSPSAKPAS